jgi:ABC-type glycerol-3-phosphate transport system permease component
MVSLFDRPSARLVALGVMGALVVFSVAPFAFIATTAFKSLGEIYASPPVWLPPQPTLDNFEYVLGRGAFGVYLRNSVLVALGTTVVSLAVCVLAGYGFSRFRFPARGPLLFAFLMVQMFPSVLLIIPLFQVMNGLGLMDSLGALVLADTTFAIPLCTWLLKGFFDQIPRELEDAAQVDGASRLGALRRVTLPLAVPGIAAAGIFVFIAAWDEFVFALTFTSSEDSRTLPIAINRFITSYEIQWNHMAAATLLVTVPVVVLFLIIQRYLAQGLLSGATKG